MRIEDRFSGRAGSYASSRPGYPQDVLKWLREICALSETSRVADIGAGTGIFTRLLLSSGCHVDAVEPNADMRSRLAEESAGTSGLRVVDGTAERTTLETSSVDLVTAAQAFHWFRRAEARQEFRRILRPGGWVALIWNERRTTGAPFLEAYEEILRRHSVDYGAVQMKTPARETILRFAGGAEVQERSTENRQMLDRDGLIARLSSNSYAPLHGDPRRAALIDAAAAAFDRYEEDGMVTMLYDTRIYCGQIEGDFTE